MALCDCVPAGVKIDEFITACLTVLLIAFYGSGDAKNVAHVPGLGLKLDFTPRITEETHRAYFVP